MPFASLAAIVATLLASPPGATLTPIVGPETVEAPAAWARYEYRRDRYDYHFDNPSSFNTSVAVPHYFEQHYREDNQWIFVGAAYPLLGGRGVTEAGTTPSRVTAGDDYDTFFQPDGNVIVYGTTADVAMRSFRFMQRIEGRRMRGVAIGGSYVYQRDSAAFSSSFSTTTQSNPPSTSSFWNTGRETTVSEVHEIQVGLSARAAPSSAWTITGAADLAPVRLARLTTILPDKYPGQDIVFLSKGVSLAESVELTWTSGRWCLDLSAWHSHTWNYSAAAQFHRNTVAAGVGVRVLLGPR